MKKLIGLLVMSVMLLSAQISFAGPQDFTLVNASNSYICYLYVSPSASSDWGDDILPECIAPGESYFITMTGYGNEALFDLRVVDDNDNGEEYYQFNLLEVSNISILGGGQSTYY